MKVSQKLEIELNNTRLRLSELSETDELDLDKRTELDTLTEKHSDLLKQKNAAIISEDADIQEKLTTEPGFMTLSDRAIKDGGWLACAVEGSKPDGAIAELTQELHPEGLTLSQQGNVLVPWLDYDRFKISGRYANTEQADVGAGPDTYRPIYPQNVFDMATASRVLGIMPDMVGFRDHHLSLHQCGFYRGRCH